MDGAALGEIVELHHLGLAVGLGGAEANGTKNSSDVGCIVFLEFFFRERIVIDKPL